MAIPNNTNVYFTHRLPDDVASFLTSRIGKLPTDVIEALCTLACFGAQTNFVILKALEKVCGIQLIAPLEVAIAEGFVDKINGHYCFSHDRLEEVTVYTLVPGIFIIDIHNPTYLSSMFVLFLCLGSIQYDEA